MKRKEREKKRKRDGGNPNVQNSQLIHRENREIRSTKYAICPCSSNSIAPKEKAKWNIIQVGHGDSKRDNIASISTLYILMPEPTGLAYPNPLRVL